VVSDGRQAAQSLADPDQVTGQAGRGPYRKYVTRGGSQSRHGGYHAASGRVAYRWSAFIRHACQCRVPGHTRPWLSPRGWTRRRRRCQSHNPGRRLGASTPAEPVAPVRQARTHCGRARRPCWTRSQQGLGPRRPRATQLGRVIPARRQRAAQRREPHQDQVRGRLPRSTAVPTGLSPGTTRPGSTRQTQAAPAPALSARRQPWKPSARWGPRLNRAAWDVPCSLKYPERAVRSASAPSGPRHDHR
jgi:hypothetical protein